MPKKIHRGPTAVLPFRLEISDLIKIDKYLRKLNRIPKSSEMRAQYGYTRNSILVMALKEFLASKYPKD